MDIKQITTLADLMVEKDLSRIEIQEGENLILLRRGQPTVVQLAAPAAPIAAPAPAAASAAPAAAKADADGLLIRSPMVGTFYAASDAESPPFVSIGDSVGPDSVVCIVEAMKVFNEIKAEVAGRISKVLIGNAEAVEYDQPLFAVSPA